MALAFAAFSIIITIAITHTPDGPAIKIV